MDQIIPDVLFRSAPRAPEVPLVFDSPHSGTEYPADFGYSCPLAALRSSEDLYVEDLFGAAPEHGATLLAALFPRCYIDVNRALADLDPALLAEPWPDPLAPGEKTKLGIGLVRRFAKPGLPVYERKLPVDEVAGRIERYYRPYHWALDEVCDRLHRKFGVVWHINCHSMQSRGSIMTSDGPEALRADFVLGDRDGTSCAPELTDFVRRVLAGRGYKVKVNEPYKGVELVRRHGRPGENRHSLQIEINRALYMDEATLERSADYGSLKTDLAHLVEALASFAGKPRVQQ
jgi:N-formylglutamate amidohydrolase